MRASSRTSSDERLDPVVRDDLFVPPALVAVGEIALPGKQLRQLGVRSLEDVLVGVDGSDAEAPLDLVGVRAGLAGEHSRVGTETDHLVAQPSVLELVQE